MPRPWEGFTLLEMLAVIAVMVVLISAAAPTFMEMSQGSALRSGVAQVRSTLSLARQYAISRNEVVYFLIAGPESNYIGESAEHVDKCGRAYAVYSIGKNPADDTHPGLGDDRYLVEWCTLPSGIVFDMEERGLKSGNRDLNVFSYSAPAREFLFPNSGPEAQLRRFRSVKFRGDGRASFGSPASVRAIILAEGGAQFDAGAIDPTDPRQYFIPENAQKLAIQIRSRSGRMETVGVP